MITVSKILTKGNVKISKTKTSLVVTSEANTRNNGIYYNFDIEPGMGYVVTITGNKKSANIPVVLSIWDSPKWNTCKKIFTTKKNIYGQKIIPRKKNKISIGVFFQSSNIGDCFFINNIKLISANKKSRGIISFDTLSTDIKNKKKPKEINEVEPETNTKKDINNFNKLTLNLDKIRELMTKKNRSNSVISMDSTALHNQEEDAVRNLTLQLEKLSKLKSNMEENYTNMLEEQKSRIKKLETEKRSMKKLLPENNKIPIQKLNVTDDENLYGSMSASMDMFPSIEMNESIESVPGLEFPVISFDQKE
jgi:DNA-binding transcriptional MerR regulator